MRLMKYVTTIQHQLNSGLRQVYTTKFYVTDMDCRLPLDSAFSFYVVDEFGSLVEVDVVQSAISMNYL